MCAPFIEQWLHFIIICRYAKEILQKEMLPHVGVGEYCETKKAYYFGFVPCLFFFFFSFHFDDLVSIYYASHCPTDISFTGYFCVHLGGGLKMIGITTATRGWTWRVLYLAVSLEWFVSLVINIVLLNLSCYVVISISQFLVAITCDAVIQKAN